MSYSKEIILGAVSMFLRGSNLRISRPKGTIFVDIEQIKKKEIYFSENMPDFLVHFQSSL